MSQALALALHGMACRTGIGFAAASPLNDVPEFLCRCHQQCPGWLTLYNLASSALHLAYQGACAVSSAKFMNGPNQTTHAFSSRKPMQDCLSCQAAKQLRSSFCCSPCCTACTRPLRDRPPSTGRGTPCTKFSERQASKPWERGTWAFSRGLLKQVVPDWVGRTKVT